jgi:hypothetical protein
MIEHSSHLYKLLHTLSQLINPALVLWVLIALYASTRNERANWRSWLALFLGIVVVYLGQMVDHKLGLWKQFGSDYSTHSALAAASLIPLAFIRRQLIPILALVMTGYAVFMILMGFHTLLDIITTLAVVIPLIVLVHFVILRRSGLCQTAESTG